MAYSLITSATTATTPLSARTRNICIYSSKNGCSPAPRVWWVGHQHQASAIDTATSDEDQDRPPHDHHSLRRRALMGLSGAVVTVLGLSLSGEQRASAAGRPPPPPPREKKDPNVSGVQAKVLASKRRKEAMKEEVAKLREKGKAIKEPPPKPPQ